MTLTAGCAPEKYLGAYVLGALDPEERSRVDAHLDVCPRCQDELADLAGLPDVLSMISPGEAERLLAVDGPGDPSDLGEAVVGLTEFRRRRTRRRDAWLSAAALIMVAATGGGLLAGHPWASGHGASQVQAGGRSYGTPTGPTRSVTGSAGGTTLTVEYSPMGWGTWVQAKVTGIAPGTNCSLAVVTAAGARVTAGGWTTDAMVGKVFYPGSAGVPANDIRGFVLTIAGGRQVTVQV